LQKDLNRTAVASVPAPTARRSGDSVTWCDSGYGWVYDQKGGDFFGAIIAFVILPWLVLRVAPALAQRWGLKPFKHFKRA
jgi:hypothetical protein